MQIRLIPPSPHPTVLYALTFPSVLPLHQLGPGATIPAAWSSQLQILTSILSLEPPSSIHMLDRAVGLVARIRSLSMDVLHKEFVVEFVDGREINIRMNSDCVRSLLGVVDDVHGCSELERNSMEGSASPGSTAGSIEDIPSGASLTRSPKPGKHKRQRSLLFSLISSLVPKSLSSPPRSPPPPSGAPPPAPLPALPVAGRVTSPPSSPLQASFPSAQPDLLRRRARATLLDVWRRHVIPALTPQHLPPAGYVEWTLIALANNVRAEIESVEAAKSHGYGMHGTRAGGSSHKRTQSEGRNALDFGDRSDDCELEPWRCRVPTTFSDILGTEDIDQVVYPRRERDEWSIRHVHPPRFSGEAEIFTVEYNSHNESLLGEHFTFGDYWEDNEPLALQLGRIRCRGMDGRLSSTCDKHIHLDDFPLDCDSDDCPRLADMAFDMSRCPLTPSDVVDDEESDDSQTSLRTPEDGEDLPLAPPIQPLQGSTQHEACSVPESGLVSRASSSRPRSRKVPAQSSSASSKALYSPAPPRMYSIDCRDVHPGEYIVSHLDYLDRVCAALEVVRTRARDEGWRLVRATLIGAKNGWMDAETEMSLEIKAKRRAWSSGIKISVSYPSLSFAPKVWDGSFSTFGSPMRPPGLSSPLKTSQAREPIVPTGLSLGIPVRSSPLAMYAWSADDGKSSTPPNKYGALISNRGTETAEGKKPSRISITDSVTKLFPVCEEDTDVALEPVRVNAVGFPQAVPISVSTEEHEYSLVEGIAENEDDLQYLYPSRPQPRMRTTSMHPSIPTSLAPSGPVLPMFRPSTPPPSYQVAVGGDVSTVANGEERGLDASALLLQPLSPLSVSPPPSPSRHPLGPNPSFVPRPRSISLPTPKSYSSTNKTRRTSFHHNDEHCEDLSQAYASPPPEGPLVISTSPAPHEQYPRYAHIHSPTPASKRSLNAAILGRTGKEVVFEQAGSEFTVGIEVTLG